MFAAVVSLALIQLALGQIDQDCPDERLRFDPKPSYCLTPNPNCNILASGVTDDEKSLILDEHNRRRNTIALGKESQGGGLPPAADMMELIWDESLAIPSQKWVEQCKNGHDCEYSTCREVVAYPVGQNIGLSYSGPNDKANWTYIMSLFYGEIKNFNPSVIPSYHPQGTQAKEYGHFSQVVWARSLRVGCGWVLYGPTPINGDDDVYSQRYACDYGPTGNVGGEPVYEEGDTCSGCPENSCCGDSCEDKNIDSKYPGLCKMLDDNTAPVYKINETEYNLYCDFRNKSDEDSRKRRDDVQTYTVPASFYDDSSEDSDNDSDGDSDGDTEDGGDDESGGATTDSNGGASDSNESGGDRCAYTLSDDKKCKLIPTLGGNIIECRLNGGENAIISFAKGFTAKETSCLNVRFRMAPCTAGDQDAGQLLLTVGGFDPADLGSSASYLNYHFGGIPPDTYPVKLEFKVPDGAPPQCMDLANIYNKSPKC